MHEPKGRSLFKAHQYTAKHQLFLSTLKQIHSLPLQAQRIDSWYIDDRTNLEFIKQKQ